MPERNGSLWARSGPLLAGALIALVSAGVQKVYSDHTLGSEVDSLRLQLREHAVILAGPSGVTVQLTEIREVLRECGGGSVALAVDPPLARPEHRVTTEAP
jgi:hypothetical protein